MTTAATQSDGPAPIVTGNMVADRLTEVTDWMVANLQIVDKQGKLVPLVPNKEQDRILTELILQELNGLAGRLIILKARKVGCSTIIAAYLYYKCHHNPLTRALVAAQDNDACISLFNITSRFHQYNPHPLPLMTTWPGRRELNFAPPNDSRYSVQTAGKPSLGRTDTPHYFHGSEIPYWPRAKQTLTSALSSTPDDFGVVVLESTANGYDMFKDLWDAAVTARQKNPDTLEGYTPIFFSWLEHDSYRRKVPDDYEWGYIDEYERDLIELGADDEQLYWRRKTLAEKCGGDASTCMQENPATPAQAFLSTGRKKIHAIIIQRHRETAMASGAGRPVRFSYNDKGELLVEDGDWNDEYWELWELPDPNCGYTIGGDVSEGLLSDRNDPKSKSDRTTAFILNRRTLQQAGRWEGPGVNENEFGREMVKAAQFFNHAWMSPEANNTGKASVLTIVELLYEHLYRRQSAADSLNREREKPQWGYKTTGGASGTRAVMIADWIDINRPLVGFGWEGRLFIKSRMIPDEENTFIIKATGKVEHDTGKHDDELFAAMIAYQLHRLCPAFEMTSFTPADGRPAMPTMAFQGGLDEYAQEMYRRSQSDEPDETQQKTE